MADATVDIGRLKQLLVATKSVTMSQQDKTSRTITYETPLTILEMRSVLLWYMIYRSRVIL